MNTVHIFDIDTTIADNTHREQMLQKSCIVCLSPKSSVYRSPCVSCGRETQSSTAQDDWDRFFDPIEVIKDIPVAKALSYADKLRAKHAVIHFITGRSENCREVTDRWLMTKFNKQIGEELIMRPEHEGGLLASEYKERAWHRLRVAKGFGSDVLPYFYEDDLHVFNMYSRHGIVVRCPEAWEFLVPDGTDDVEKSWPAP